MPEMQIFNGHILTLSGLGIAYVIAAYYSYTKKHFATFVVGTFACTLWGLSAVMNAWSGWTTGAVMGFYAALFGLTFMLLTETIAPSVMVYHKKTETRFNFLLTLSFVMAVCLSIFSFSNGLKAALDTHVATSLFSENMSDASATKAEGLKLKVQGIEEAPQHDTSGLKRTISQILNAKAKNLAGNLVYLDGKVATVSDVTRNCTGGEYANNPKLYRNECGRVKSLRAQIRKLEASNELNGKNKGEVAVIKLETAKALSEGAQHEFKTDTELPIIKLIKQHSQVDCGGLEKGACEKAKKQAVSELLGQFALVVAIFSELAKNAMVFMFIGLLIPTRRKHETRFNVMSMITAPAGFASWVKQLAESFAMDCATSKGEKLAELEFRKDLTNQKKRETYVLLQADDLMMTAKHEDLSLILDYNTFLHRKQVSHSDIYMLCLLFVRLFKECEHIPIHGSRQLLLAKAKDDEQFIKSVTDGMKIDPLELYEFVNGLTKVHRITNIVLPLFERHGLVEIRNGSGGKAYYWASNTDIENAFSVAIKKKRGVANV